MLAQMLLLLNLLAPHQFVSNVSEYPATCTELKSAMRSREGRQISEKGCNSVSTRKDSLSTTEADIDREIRVGRGTVMRTQG